MCLNLSFEPVELIYMGLELRRHVPRCVEKFGHPRPGMSKLLVKRAKFAI